MGRRELRVAVTAAAFFLAAAGAPARAQIVNTLRGFDEDAQGWSGDVEVRFSVRGGNTELLSLAAGGRAQLVAGRHRWRAIADGTRTESGGETIGESAFGHLRHNFRLRPRVSTLAFAQVQRDPFQRLESRRLLGAGLRVDFLRRAGLAAALGASHMLEWEEVEERADVDLDHRLSAFLTLAGTPNERTTVDVSAFWQPLWSDFADARATLAASLRVSVAGALSLLVSADVQHDTEPPERVEDTDWRLVTGLSWGF